MSIRAAVMTAPGAPLETWDYAVPELLPGGIRLETVASEVCGTDVHLFHGRLAGVPYPIVPGHVSVGRIAELRDVENDALGVPLSSGDLVTFYDVHEVCGSCWHCLVARQPNRCPSRRVYGITYPARGGLLGGWAEGIELKPGVRVLKLPPELTPDDFMGGGCGLITGFAAVERSELQMGDVVVVQGSGPVGLAAAAWAAIRGAGLVVVIGAPASRLELAPAFGADITIALEGTSAEERTQCVRDLTSGLGADVVLEATGNPRALTEGLQLLRDGGTYVVAGHYTDTGNVSLNPHRDLNAKHADVRGQWGTDFHHWHGALRMLAKHHERLPFARTIGARYPLSRAQEALADVEAMRVTKALITP